MNIRKIEEQIKNVEVHGWTVLKLRNCGLREIPQKVYEFTDLINLDLGNDEYCLPEMRNQITTIPDEINCLSKLKRLNLSGNVLTTISNQVGNIQGLQYLNLKNNRLTDLSPNIANLSELKELHLLGNPFELLPPEIVARGINSIRNFYKELDEKDFIYEAKLIIVGEGRVGKTCISKALKETNYTLKSEESTEGINIQPWIIEKDHISSINPNIQRDLQINVWDFGGQEIYHSTHQFFLTKRSLYMLVTESRKEDRHEDFYYWLNVIKLLGDKSPVVMVLNKCDQPTKELPIKEYKELFNNIVDFSKISLHDDYREDFNQFKNNLIKRASELHHIGTPLPKKWVDIRIELELLKVNGRNFISEEEYLEICRKHYRNTESAMYLSDFFHDLGVILHFRDDIELKDTVILNHEWITRGVYKILDDRKVIEQKGRFNNEDIARIWNESEFSSKGRVLISLMKNRKFDLCFQLESGDYLVPRLLPVDEIEYSQYLSDRTTKFEIQYKFMPKGIVARLIVKMSRDIYNNVFWRTGVLLKYENTIAIVKEKYFENKIIIELTGSEKREFLAIIRKTIADINKDFNNVEIDEKVPCNCEECINQGQPHFYSYSLLRRYELSGINEIRCENSLLNIEVKVITNDLIGNHLESIRYYYCENLNYEIFESLKFENCHFHPERDSAGVYLKTRAHSDRFGIRDRDFLTDPEVERIRVKHPNYYILGYYAIENYLYHPDNISQLNISNFNKSEYTNEIIKQKNTKKYEIISNFKKARDSYQEFKVESDKFKMKIHESKIIEYLESDDVEVFLKAFSMKDHFDKSSLSKYGLSEIELAATTWFRNKMKVAFGI